MAIQDDFTVSQSGDIRYVGAAHGANGAGYYSVIQLHRWLQDLADDAVASASSSDFLDITDSTPSERSTDNIITLLSPYNIDDVAAEHLFDGSVIQNNGDVIYDGLVVIAGVGMDLQIIQNGSIISNDFWNTIPFGDSFKGLNKDTNNGISHRFMIKVRSGGADIDGRRVLGQTRVWGKTFSDFRVNGTSRGNNVMALAFSDDLNNATLESTVAGYTTITNQTQGYVGLDVNNDTTNEFYYSEWDKASYTINQFYERMKWLSGQSRIESQHTDGGTNYPIGNGTITRQAQSFAVGVNSGYLMHLNVRLKKVGLPTGNITAKLYSHTGTFGSSGTPNTELDASLTIDVSKLTSSYDLYQFQFNTPVLMTNATNYFVSLEYSGGDVSNYVDVEGDGDGGHPGNRASWDGSWTASAGTDLRFSAFTSPDLYGIPGELFRGITHELDLTTPRTGTFNSYEPVSWGSGATAGTGQMLAINNTSTGTKMWIQLKTGVAPSGSVTITGGTSSATTTYAGTLVERPLSTPFCGVSTGSALIGSYGFGVEPTDLTANDKLFDLTNTQITPPNFVTFTVLGLISGEDYVLVGPESGGTLQLNQLSLNTALTTDNITSVVVTTAIPSDTPSSGTIRVADNNGVYRRLTYSSWTGSTFTITSVDGNEDFASVNASANNNVFISYIDTLADATSESFTTVYSTNRSLFVRVRDGGGSPIKTFETSATLGSAGGSSTAIRTADQ
jgi:hypothetical protein